jgi:hypothetical protein
LSTEKGFFEHEIAGLDLGEIEDVVEDLQQMVGGNPQDFEDSRCSAATGWSAGVRSCR